MSRWNIRFRQYSPSRRRPVRNRRCGRVSLPGRLEPDSVGVDFFALGGGGLVAEFDGVRHGGTDQRLLRQFVEFIEDMVKRQQLAVVPEIGGGQPVVVIIPVETRGEREILEIRDAAGRLPFFARLIQRRKQHGGEDGDDRDNHQEFDEGERIPFHGESPSV